MGRKAVSRIMLTLLLISMLTLTFNIQPAEASGTIYIRADGSVEPVTAPISSVDNITYTFTDNIYHEIVVERDNIVVDGAGYTVQGTGSGAGIYLSYRNNVTIRNMEIKAFDGGIIVYHSSNNTVSGNNITNNESGILLSGSSNNTVSGNNITNNRWIGVELDGSSNNTVSGNNITQNNGFGIRLSASSNNTLRNNDASNNEYNFFVYGWSLPDYIQDIDYSNTVNGKPVYYWVNGRDMAVPLDAGYVALVNCTRITVKNLNLTNNAQGALLAFTTNSTITKNNITNNGDGIDLYESSNNTVSGNNITENDWDGVGLHTSSNNGVSGNNITNNSYGIMVNWGSNNAISGNNITQNNWDGIMLDRSSDNVLSGNKITENNGYGIWLVFYSNYNIIYGNDITNNRYGIKLYSASNNIIYHNNFVDNTFQVYSSESTNVWDDGYPSGGNYWSDYSVRYPLVKDEYQGENQDVLGSDGIWDCPYEIDVDNQDRYPFVEPWSPLPRTMGELKAEIEKCWSEGEIDNQGIVKSLIAKLNVAQKLVDKGKIDEAKSILEEDFIPQVQNLTDVHITPEAADILIKSAEHIISHL